MLCSALEHQRQEVWLVRWAPGVPQTVTRGTCEVVLVLQQYGDVVVVVVVVPGLPLSHALADAPSLGYPQRGQQRWGGGVRMVHPSSKRLA